MKRILVGLMAMLLTLGVLPAPVPAASEGAMTGSGTSGDPYIVTTLAQLDAVRNDLTAHYRLGADIDASETAAWNGGLGFEPIGSDGAFSGVLDGDGHAIRHLTINRPSQDIVGLFGTISPGGVVRDLSLEGGSVTGGIYVGGLAGRSDGTVTETHSTGNVSGGHYVGGLVGTQEGGELTRSYFAGTVGGVYNIGGLVGGVSGGTIRLSYNIGSVSGDHVVGGLAGITVFGYVGRSYSSGPLSAVHGDVGGALGANNGAVMEDNYWDADTSGQAVGCGFNNDAYGVPCAATMLTTAQALAQASYAGFDFAADWYMADGATRPFLRSEWSSTVGNAHQLQLMAMDLTADYSLAGDIAFGTTFTDDSRSDMWATSAGAGAGFAPIGDENAGAFVGRIDGKGHAVRGLLVNRPGTGQVGLIGYLGDGGLVRAIGVEGGSMRGSYSTGGLVGDNRGGTVELSYSTADVSGGNKVGGLVGNMLPGVVRQSYATGEVSGTNAVGGLVGCADLGSAVEDAYAIGSVSGNAEVGGLFGRHVGTIERAYAAGPVSGTLSDIGGLAGRNFIGVAVIASSYHDAATSGQGGGKPTAVLKRQSTFADWDFDGIWTIEEGRTYPVLRGIAANLDLDASPPAIVDLRIERPDRLLLTFDEDVNLASAGGFAVQADGNGATIVGDEKIGSRTLALTLGAELPGGQDVRLSYDAHAGSVVDLAGNPLSSVADQPWPPDIEIAITTADGNGYADGTWTDQPVTVSAAVYGGNGATEFFYSLDGGRAWAPYTSSFELRDDGVHTIDWKAVDSAGMETAAQRTVKISAHGLRLTPTLANADGSAYTEGQWSNQSVTVSVYAEGGAGGIASFAYTVDGGAPQAYANDEPIAFSEDGVHRIVFEAEDEAGHTLAEELEVKIDRTPPTVAFAPNGRESAAPSASVGTTVSDAGSGRDDSTLEYAWTAGSSAPADGWMPFASGADLTKSGATGDWYLHIRAADQAGNRTEAVSNRFRLGRPSSDWVPMPNNAYLISPNGGSAKFEGGEISFPAGAMERPFLVTIDEIADTSTLPLSDKERLASRAFEIRKDVPGRFLAGVTVKLRLNDDVARQDGIEIVLCWLDEATGRWVALSDSNIDGEKGTISGTTDHFTKFAAIARTVDRDEPAAVFTDIRGHWAEETILRLAKSGAVGGYPDGTFRPDRPITRAEFASILTAALQLAPAEGKTFADTERHWAREAISTAYADGWIRGYDDRTFAPDEPITREQMAAMAANALHLEQPTSAPIFADGDRISSWAREAVAAAAARGILSGYPDGTLRPQGQATRAEAVMAIVRTIGSIGNK